MGVAENMFFGLRLAAEVRMDGSAPHKCDVAFSFLARDEAIAGDIADRLRDRYGVFVYSEQQKELAGTDGVETFSRVFRTAARVCVILYRDGWGETKWTRLEATAIKERALDQGWAFLLVIRLDSSAPPLWIPTTKLWFDWVRNGLDGAAGAIETRIQEAGGEPHDEGVRERAERLTRQRQRDEDLKRFLDSDLGVQAARAEVQVLFGLLRAEAESVSNIPGGMHVIFTEESQGVCNVTSRGIQIRFVWNQQYGNTLEHSRLLVTEYLLRDFDDKRRIDHVRLTFTRDTSEQPLWTGPSQTFSSSTLVQHYLKRLLDRAFGGPESG